MDTRHNIKFSLRFSLFLGLIMTYSSPLLADADRDNSLKDLAIVSTLIGWFTTSLYDKSPVNEALKINLKNHQIGFSQGKETSNTFRQIYYGKDFSNTLIRSRNINFKGHWEFGLDTWNSSLKNSDQPTGFIARAIPVYSLEPTRPLLNYDIKPYLEFGVGINYLSNSVIENKQKSSQFHFVEYLGTGLHLGKIKLGYRFMHISNAGISSPNPATDVHSFNISYHFFNP